MTSSREPQRVVRPVSTRGFVAASTAPAPAPRVFVATPAAGGARPAVRDFETFEVPGRETEATTRVREAARAAGFAQGWSAGLRQAAERAAAERAVEREMADLAARNAEVTRATALQRASDTVAAAARALTQREDPHVGALADTVLELALDLAGAVLDRELTLSGSPVLDAVQRALRPLDPTSGVLVRVHPDDLAVLTGQPGGGPLKGSGPGAENVPVSFPDVSYQADPTLAPGDAVALQGDTEVDARLRSSVARALQVLTQQSETSEAVGQVR